MRRFIAITFMVCLVAGAHLVQAGEILDRIIAIVNNTPVLLSDWEEAWRTEALLAGRTPDSYSKVEQQEVFNRLVDQELLRQQMRGYLLSPIAAADLQERLQAVRNQLSGGKEKQWHELLEHAGVTEEELRGRLERQMEIERFVDVRFRAGIRIDDRSVSRYYNDQFLPELRRSGSRDVPLDEVSGKIREILLQQRLEEQLAAWIQTLREQAEIRIPPAMSSDSTGAEATRSQ